jgi:HSP20 family protein
LDRLFDDGIWGQWLAPFSEGVERAPHVPAVDVYEENGHVVVRAELPGVEKDHVHINATGDQLTLEAERKSETETQEDRYYRRELHSGRLHRCIPLPTEVKHEEAKATFKDGVLQVRLPKVEEQTSRTIEIE